MTYPSLQQQHDNADTPWDEEEDLKCEDCGQQGCVCAQLDGMDE